MIKRLLFKHIDNSPLIVFRIIFGFLITAEAFGAIMTGWVKRVFIEPKFTFNFIGFDFLQPLLGEYMYVHFVIMGIFGIFVMLGYKYRFSIIAYTVFWSIAYFLQKSSYNNHYYLLILLCGIMAFLPAHKYLSIDVKKNPALRRNSMPRWCSWVMILQVFIVYTYGSIAKLYPDWLDTTVIELFMKGKQHYYIIGDFLQNEWLHYFIAYGGILYDGLAVPFLLYKPTRKYAFFASIFFHLFNSIVFQVGIFPYMALAFSLFFFEPKTIQRIFLKRKTLYEDANVIVPKYSKPLILGFSLYFLIQLALPLRHHFFKDNVLWTEEGHRMSWRMMLRTKSGNLIVKVVDKDSGHTKTINLQDHVTPKQRRKLATHPDFMWQFAQYLKRIHARQGKDIEVYVESWLSVNQKPSYKFIDTNIDLASVKWNPFKHSEWILPSKID